MEGLPGWDPPGYGRSDHSVRCQTVQGSSTQQRKSEPEIKKHESNQVHNASQSLKLRSTSQSSTQQHKSEPEIKKHESIKYTTTQVRAWN